MVTADTQLYRLIGAIARQSTTSVNQQVKDLGLDNNLFLYLIRIVENAGISQTDLVKLVRVDKTTLSRALKRLEDDDYIVKEIDPKNKKLKHLLPTTKGQATYPLIAQIEADYIHHALTELNPTELTTLTNLLNKIYQQL
ncbi:MarR family winged helix-turn-helix transcriptional regulator [Lapidilactobacillus wuchangensis]|uniref:MarR family winged helix-turn-helix transcriptional regulator n=1 Tax=Lapidilactobacillus wuchangensis TaxID=2486001 RepID=UPI000F768100|nr:MarR family transcriptional regulator [Lapidilactobacillus wuchangensis]